jgi:hypothetical protein
MAQTQLIPQRVTDPALLEELRQLYAIGPEGVPIADDTLPDDELPDDSAVPAPVVQQPTRVTDPALLEELKSLTPVPAAPTLQPVRVTDPALLEELKTLPIVHSPPTKAPVRSFAQGALEQGNIDLTNRPRVKNPDGSISTVDSVTKQLEDGRAILLPRITDDGRHVKGDEAARIYNQTGKHLGIFRSIDDADLYARGLHVDQEKLLNQPPPAKVAPVKNFLTPESKRLNEDLNDQSSLSGDVNFSYWALRRSTAMQNYDDAVEEERRAADPTRRIMTSRATSRPYTAKERDDAVIEARKKQRAALQDFREIRKKLAENPESPAYKRFNEADGFTNSIGVYMDDPWAVTRSLMGRSAMLSAPSMVMGAVGSLGGPIGTMIGSGMGSYLVEYSSALADAMDGLGVNINDPEAVKKAWKDHREEITSNARLGAAVVAMFDAYSGGIATVLADKAVKGTLKKKLLEIVYGTGWQGLLGGMGEATKQDATGQKRNWPAILGEGIAEMPGGVVEVGTSMATAPFRRGDEAGTGPPPPGGRVDPRLFPGTQEPPLAAEPPPAGPPPPLSPGLFRREPPPPPGAAPMAPRAPRPPDVELPVVEGWATQEQPQPLQPETGEVPMVRLYHGGAAGTQDGGRWVTSDRAYAEGYAAKSAGGQVYYIDLPADDPRIVNQRPYGQEMTVAFELDPENTSRMQPLTPEKEKSTQFSPNLPPRATPPPTAQERAINRYLKDRGFNADEIASMSPEDKDIIIERGLNIPQKGPRPSIDVQAWLRSREQLPDLPAAGRELPPISKAAREEAAAGVIPAQPRPPAPAVQPAPPAPAAQIPAADTGRRIAALQARSEPIASHVDNWVAAHKADPDAAYAELDAIEQETRGLERDLVIKYGVNNVAELEDAPLTKAERNFLFHDTRIPDRERASEFRRVVEPVKNLDEAVFEIGAALQRTGIDQDSTDRMVARLNFLHGEIQRMGRDPMTVMKLAIMKYARRVSNDASDQQLIFGDIVGRLVDLGVSFDDTPAQPPAEAPQALPPPAPAAGPKKRPSRSRRALGEREPILTALIRAGGLKDKNGELRNRDLHNYGIPKLGRLRQPETGMDDDEARAWAIQEGYAVDPGDLSGGVAETTEHLIYDLIDEERSPTRGGGQARTLEDAIANYPPADQAFVRKWGLELYEGLRLTRTTPADWQRDDVLAEAKELVDRGWKADEALEMAADRRVADADDELIDAEVPYEEPGEPSGEREQVPPRSGAGAEPSAEGGAAPSGEAVSGASAPRGGEAQGERSLEELNRELAAANRRLKSLTRLLDCINSG